MNKSRKLHKQSGFTLVEMLVVLCLLALLMGFFLQCFVFAMEQYQHRMALLELEDNLSVAMSLIASDVANCTKVVACDAERLTLTGTKTIYYNLGTDTQAQEHFYDLEGKILYRRESTQWNRQPMANFISRFCVTYYDHTGTVTDDAETVHAIEVFIEGIWKANKITHRQILCLKDSEYL